MVQLPASVGPQQRLGRDATQALAERVLLLQAPEKYVLVRLICHPLAAHNARFFEEWSVRLAGWIAAGTNFFFMVHCPNDAYSPPLARQFNALMVARMGAATLPAWPVPQLALDW